MGLTLKGVNGDLPAAAAALYTCPASTSAIVKSIWLENIGPDPVEAEIYTARGASTKGIRYGWLGPYECLQAGERGAIVILAAGEALHGYASVGATVSFDLAIIERSA